MSNTSSASGDSRCITKDQWVIPPLILAICVISFGTLFSRLGFFQDDWHHVFYAYWQGSRGLQHFLFVDRGPFAWIVYAFLFKILGFSPESWHWWLMLLRAATSIMFWFSLRLIWPRQRSLAWWTALLFTIYPIFTLQPLSVAYALHWTMYLVFMLSLFLMLSALQNMKYFVLLTMAALLFEATHLVFIEYFSGLELGRIIFIWLFFSNLGGRDRIRKTLKCIAPYLIVLGIYVVYRSSFGAIFGYDRFTPLATVTELIRTPGGILIHIYESIIQDIIYVLFTQWYAAINPVIIDLSRISTYLILGSILGAIAIAYGVATLLQRRHTDTVTHETGTGSVTCGFVLILLSILPFWLTGFSIFQKNLLWSERLALAAMPGASLLMTGAVFTLIDRYQPRYVVLGALLGLGMGLQVQIARNYQASWDKQKDFYWQLHWRAPALEANTLIASDQEILFYMGIYPTAFAINVLYPQVTTPPEASYWFNAGSEHVSFDKFVSGEPVTFEKYATSFTARASHVIAIAFEPGEGQCLWILGPQLANVRGLTPSAAAWLGISDKAQIKEAPDINPPEMIFGPEPKHTWCYFYEKADLASQYQEWGKAIELWREAGRQQLRAANGIELLPFISSFGHLGNWEEAQTLTEQAQDLPDRSTSVLCDLWRDLEATTTPSADRDRAVMTTLTRLGCQN